MKKLFGLLMAALLSVTLMNACGGAGEKEKDEKTKDAKEKIAEKAAPGLTLKLNDEPLHFNNAELSYDEMFGPQLTVSAFMDADAEEGGAVTSTVGFFSINIEDIEPGEDQITNISLMGYNVSEANATVSKFKTGSGMFGAVVDEVVLEFSATVFDEVGEEHSLTGTYVK